MFYEPMSACGVREEVTLVFDSPIRHGNPPLGTKMGERREGETPIFLTPPPAAIAQETIRGTEDD